MAPDGIIYWTEGNIGVDSKLLQVGVVVDVFYKKVSQVKYPIVVWVEKQMPKSKVEIEQVELSEVDAEILLEAIDNPPEPNDALKDLMKSEDDLT